MIPGMESRTFYAQIFALAQCRVGINSIAFTLSVPFTAAVLDTEGLPDSGLNTSSWVTGVKPPLSSIYNLHDMQLAVKNYLGETQYAYIRTGSLDELSMLQNIFIRLIPHQTHGRNVLNVSTEQTLLGTKFSVPFFIAPAGYSSFTDPENGELNLVKGAGNQGALYVPSILSSKTTAEMAAAKLSNQTLFRQIYPWANRTRLLNDFAQAEASGYKAIFLTLDNPTVQGIRTRALRNGAPDSSGTYSTDRSLQSAAELQKSTKLPIVPKGIISWEDAKMCADLGFKANAPEVFTKMEVYADGGVRHGTDIAKLLALGVKGIGIGRSAVFSNAWGVEGVEKFFSLLKRELTTTMMLLGVTDVSQLDRTYVNTKAVENMMY
ncbi:FMN-dependent alpha-hydroxy acid dehydrogenase [Rhizoctonia solani]|uniref:FMN-dependent alpha-hydroxy acid dehydrogenase n=1 Tax=Rhizoctonia solani TaxID=456999 RepID=A0A8H8SX65_9AGAM|nr:FMN-dependent alpha-hydroxy acid dehydrogenase [Rhizoctonia solani]QRW21791.1 FMN-dependent alpha-hydroxy acid dehydrogenase [Rhizoctonia solani]